MRFKISLRGIALLSILFVLIIFAWKLGLNLFYFLSTFIFFFMAGNLLFLFLQVQVGNLLITRQLNNVAIEDDILQIKLNIHNASPFPKFLLLLEDEFTADLTRRRRYVVEKIGTGRSSTVTYMGECTKRGLYQIGPVTVTFSDLVGFLSLSKRYKVYSELAVYPKIFKIYRFPPLVKGNISLIGLGARRFSGDEFEFFGVREYRPGDPTKLIHWRSSARRNTLIVKEYEQFAAYNVSIILNLSRSNNIGSGKESTAEYAIKIAASCAKYLIERGVLVQLIAHNIGPVVFPFNKGKFFLQEMLKFLATAEIQGHVSLSELLTVNSSLIPVHSSVFLIMSDTDSDALINIAQLRARDVTVIPVVLLNSTFIHPDKPEAVKSQKLQFLSSLGILGMGSFFIARGDVLEDKFYQAIK